MWNIASTTELMKGMSKASEPGELVRLFFEHVHRGIDVQRALVLGNAGLSRPHYRLVNDFNGTCESDHSVATRNEFRHGGALAEILYTGKFQNIAYFTPNASDPAFDLLRGSQSLMAFPLFEKGMTAGAIVMLGSSPFGHNPDDLCTLAMMSALLGRAIESQKLADRLEATCRALDSELEAAANVQRWLLPTVPVVDNLRIAALYRTARYSGGDYYDVGKLPDGRIGVFIADVSGKGAPAAVLMAVLRSIIHDELDREGLTSPAALLDYADARLRALGLPERGAFVTAFCAALDSDTGTLTYSCAGHNPPRLLRIGDRNVVSLEGAKTIPLGLLDEQTKHTEEAVVLMPGDLALLYTDGITEARSPTGDFFSVERLDQILCDLPDPLSPDAAVHGISKAVAKFEQDGTPADDQTVLALSRFVHQG